MNLQISKIIKRIRELDLQVAESKTEVVIFRSTKHKLLDTYHIRVGQEIIPTKRTMKYLGIYLDQDLKFKEHVDYIEEKSMRISQKLGRLMPNLRGPMEKKRKLFVQ